MRKIELKSNNAYNYVLVTVDGVTRFCPDDGTFPYVYEEEDEKEAQEWLNREADGFFGNFDESWEEVDPDEYYYDKDIAGWYEWDFRAILEEYGHLTPREIKKELNGDSFYLSLEEYLEYATEDNENLDEDERETPEQIMEVLDKKHQHKGNDLVEMPDGQRFVICWCN